METAAPSLPCSSMTKLQKLAALLIILGPDSASELLKHLDEEELEAVSAEMARLTFISQEMQHEILQEFTEVAVAASAAVLGGPGYAKKALERSVGPSRASEIIRRVAPAAAPLPAMEPLLEMDPSELFNLLRPEQPQTIALIASYLTPERSSQLLALLPPPDRDQVVERLAMMGPAPVEVIERVVKVLSQRAGPQPARALSQTGGVRTAAALLNSLEKNLSQSVLQDLEKRNPELGREIRQKMFTFEDLVLLGPSALQKIMREIDLRDLAMSLKTAGVQLKNILLSAVSKRAAANVHEEISMLGPLRKGEIEAAQGRIVKAVRHLEDVGEVDLNNLRNSYRNELLV
ncbi:MAG TPA: flagellar motor switch protein FliG [Candidatus Acidoferrum sp.]|nr:flagellar motor switch protein FliG [Candidatus Acidoferrum sp.]